MTEQRKWLRSCRLSLLLVLSLSVCSSAAADLFASTASGSTPSWVAPTWEVEHEYNCRAPEGPVDDASCDVEAVEQANKEQLHSILKELVNTTYFRLMHINLEGQCRFWDKSVSEAKCASEGAGKPTVWAAGRAVGFSSSSSAGSAQEGGPTQCSLDLSGGPLPPVDEDDDSDDEDDEDDDDDLSNLVDKTISLDEKETIENQDSNCDDASLPDFWLDMCQNIPTNASEYVNLQLNPERWTGYNGSHVWNAIYNENCFEKMGALDEMCYEERVLYRLLSGMHTSVNIHISLAYYPPSKKENRTTWAPNPQRFMQQYGAHPDRLKNLHFAFVVMLRALRKAGPYLYNYPFNVGEPQQDEKTQILVRRLLDSHVMTNCQPVFEAFDESLMFREGDELGLASLKSQWKGVFQNISNVLDCVSCQKCKLHGKIQLLGLGTALKILLIPAQMLSTSVTRPELVALFNTVEKFSNAIHSVPFLTSKFQELQRQYRSSILSESAASSPKESSSSKSPETAPIQEPEVATPVPGPPTTPQTVVGNKGRGRVEQEIQQAMGIVAEAAQKQQISHSQEDLLVDLLLSRVENIMILARTYAELSPERFLRHALRQLGA